MVELEFWDELMICLLLKIRILVCCEKMLKKLDEYFMVKSMVIERLMRKLF